MSEPIEIEEGDSDTESAGLEGSEPARAGSGGSQATEVLEDSKGVAPSNNLEVDMHGDCSAAGGPSSSGQQVGGDGDGGAATLDEVILIEESSSETETTDVLSEDDSPSGDTEINQAAEEPTQAADSFAPSDKPGDAVATDPRPASLSAPQQQLPPDRGEHSRQKGGSTDRTSPILQRAAYEAVQESAENHLVDKKRSAEDGGDTDHLSGDTMGEEGTPQLPPQEEQAAAASPVEIVRAGDRAAPEGAAATGAKEHSGSSFCGHGTARVIEGTPRSPAMGGQLPSNGQVDLPPENPAEGQQHTSPEVESRHWTYFHCPFHPECQELLLNNERLLAHLEAQHPECPYCQVVLDGPLKAHMDEKHCCCKCNYLGSTEELEEHVRLVHSDCGPDQCPFCGEGRLLTEDERETHIRRVHTCSICQAVAANLDRHIGEEHCIKCPGCQTGPFQSQTALLQHMAACPAESGNHPGNDPMPYCPKCNMGFAGKTLENRQHHAEHCNIDPKSRRKRMQPERFSPSREWVRQQRRRHRAASQQRPAGPPEPARGPGGAAGDASHAAHQSPGGSGRGKQPVATADLGDQSPLSSGVQGGHSDGPHQGEGSGASKQRQPPCLAELSRSLPEVSASQGEWSLASRSLCSANHVVREMGLQSSLQERQSDGLQPSSLSGGSEGFVSSVNNGLGNGINSHMLLSQQDQERAWAAIIAEGGEVTISIVLDKNLASKRRHAAGKWNVESALEWRKKDRKIVVLIPKGLPPQWADGEKTCACGKGHKENLYPCDCVKSLMKLLGPFNWQYELPKYLQGKGRCRVERVPADDPRVQLRGFCRLVTERDLKAGDVVLVYQGRMMTEAEYNSMKKTPPDEWREDDTQWETHCERYALDMSAYNSHPEGGRQSQDKLMLHAFRCGNETSCANDPAIISCAEDIDEWDSHKLENGDLDNSNVKVVAHIHPPNRFGNVVLQEFLICEWPYPFLVAVCEIKAGEELLLQYGHKYWTAMTELLPSDLRPSERS
eukprot:CAMPEP_0117697926 /NCGR_PEP_ID=MMETSP0804-20121206/29496_1 /TAXON_ID=1074897 /ORGANISM="Tetraselmis astigmatica, Strain CCMP880" /LENGTH=1007 /DNA_ID=CAMNT_0005512223 /DNA_START=75 /DNA_END=3098 /DNA_ORIENTATION=+